MNAMNNYNTKEIIIIISRKSRVCTCCKNTSCGYEGNKGYNINSRRIVATCTNEIRKFKGESKHGRNHDF
jgi:hypothetical protein